MKVNFIWTVLWPQAVVDVKQFNLESYFQELIF